MKKKDIFFIILFSFILMSICLFLSLEQECFAYETKQELPTQVVNFLESSQYYNNADYDYLAYRYSSTGCTILFIPKSNSSRIYTDIQSGTTWLRSNNYFHVIGYNFDSNFNYTTFTDNNVGWSNNSNSALVINNQILNSFPIYNAHNGDTIYYEADVITEPPTEYDNIFDAISQFFGDFWNNILHIVVPSSEDIAQIQDNFTTKILSKFTITKLVRTSDYSNNDKYPSINYNDKMPIITILGYEFDTSMIKNFMNTPFDFGKLRFYSGMTENNTQINTGGLTPMTFTNLIIGLDCALLNITLFNKFFNKGE